MKSPIIARDLDFLSARLHGRRSGMAEGARLEALCSIPSVSDLGRVICADNESLTAGELQRRLTRQLAYEIADYLPCLNGTEALVAKWLLERFQIANLKIIARGILAGRTPDSIRNLLLDLPPNLPPDPALSTSETVDDLLRLLSAYPLGDRLRHSCPPDVEKPDPFIIEAGLDSGYFRDGLVLARSLPEADRDRITAMIIHEADQFNVMLVIRGRFQHGLPPSKLSPFYISGAHLPPRALNAMMIAHDVSAAATLAASHFVPHLPAGESFSVTTLETLLWRHTLTLANRAFRHSTSCFGTLAGYVGLRKIEVTNLITLSEGIRMKVKQDRLRLRMIPPLTQELSHV